MLFYANKTQMTSFSIEKYLFRSLQLLNSSSIFMFFTLNNIIEYKIRKLDKIRLKVYEKSKGKFLNSILSTDFIKC